MYFNKQTDVRETINRIEVKMKYDKLAVGDNLKEIRTKLNISAGEAGDMVECSESHIRQLERGCRNLTVNMLCKFTEAYDTDANTILGIKHRAKDRLEDNLSKLSFDEQEKCLGLYADMVETMVRMKEAI